MDVDMCWSDLRNIFRFPLNAELTWIHWPRLVTGEKKKQKWKKKKKKKIDSESM